MTITRRAISEGVIWLMVLVNVSFLWFHASVIIGGDCRFARLAGLTIQGVNCLLLTLFAWWPKRREQDDAADRLLFELERELRNSQ